MISLLNLCHYMLKPKFMKNSRSWFLAQLSSLRLPILYTHLSLIFPRPILEPSRDGVGVVEHRHTISKREQCAHACMHGLIHVQVVLVVRRFENGRCRDINPTSIRLEKKLDFIKELYTTTYQLRLLDRNGLRNLVGPIENLIWYDNRLILAPPLQA